MDDRYRGILAVGAFENYRGRVHMDIDSIISDIYEASTGDHGWLSLGRTLFAFLGADAGSLRFFGADGRSTNVFALCEPGEDRYANHFLDINPVRSGLGRMKPGGGDETVLIVDDVVDSAVYHRSEFYQDFARPNGQKHMLIGLVGDADRTIISFFREGRAFGTVERRALARLLPHVRRGLQLRQRVYRCERDARLAYAAFEALPGNAVLVDGECNVLFANSAAMSFLARKEVPISLSVAAGGGARLVIDRGEGSRLRHVVQETARGGEGGALRFEFDESECRRIGQLAVFISPLSAQVGSTAGCGSVLLLMNEISRPRTTPASIFSDLFGLSAAEGAVAAALLGGQTAELVARDRDVSLDTVRAQIRTVLRKTDATNLRDFERIGAVLGTFGCCR